MGNLLPVSHEVVFRTEDYQQAIADVKLLADQHGTFTLAQARDHWGTTRRYVQDLLEQLELARNQEDREKLARVRYKEAGYGEDNPLQIEVRYNTNDTNKKVAVAIQAMWRDVLGVEATLINEEFQVLLTNMREAEVTQVFRSSWIGDYNDAHTFLSVLQGGNAANMPRYSSDEYDGLMERAAQQVDPERRRLYLEEAERVMLAADMTRARRAETLDASAAAIILQTALDRLANAND